MRRTLTALAFAGLTGCAWMYTPQTDVAGSTFQYRAGTGVVESVSPAPGSSLDRLAIRMDDGRLQYLDTDRGEVARGMRVRLTDERLIEKR
jgi:hypothetical protein